MLSVRLDNSTENQLILLSQQREMSKSKIIKDALLYYFNMLKKESKEKTSYVCKQRKYKRHSKHR